MSLNNLFSIDPYRLVLFNSISLAVTFAFVLAWYLRKKSFPPAALIAALAILPVISIFRAGTYESGDLTFQAYKLLGFYHNLQEGNLIPRWAGELNGTYGYPSYLFTYQLPYYIGSVFHFLGLSFINSVKATLVLSYLASGWFFYAWIQKHVSKIPAVAGTLLYLFAPYRFVNLHFRATLGENVALAVLPLAAWCAHTYASHQKFVHEVSLSVAIAALIISHHAVAMLAVPWLFMYMMYVTYSSNGRYILSMRPFIIGFLLSAYFWIPLIIDGGFTQQNAGNVRVLFAPFIDFIVSQWMYGFLFQGNYGELSPALGYVHWAFIITSCILLVKLRFDKLLLFFVLTFLMYFVSAQSFSPTWDLFPILHRMQFSYRYLNVLVFLSSATAAIAIQKKLPLNQRKRMILAAILVFAVVSTILNWGNRKTVPSLSGEKFEDYAPYSTAQGEGFDPAIPIWAHPEKPWHESPPNQHIESTTFPIKILSEERSITHHSYQIEAETDSIIQENTMYFPGWTVLVDGVPEPVYIHHGLMRFYLPKGTHAVDVRFESTPYRDSGLRISLLTVMIICVESIRRYAQSRK